MSVVELGKQRFAVASLVQEVEVLSKFILSAAVFSQGRISPADPNLSRYTGFKVLHPVMTASATAL